MHFKNPAPGGSQGAPVRASAQALQRLAPVPVYYRLQESLRGMIEEGVWRPGELIPSERIIAQEQGLSVGTVKKAISNLVNAGYLYRVQGKGTFVAGTTLRRDSLRYYRLMRQFEDEPAELSVRFAGLKEIRGRESVNAFLRIPSQQSLYELRRVFLMEGSPVVYCVSYLPRKSLRDLENIPASRFEHSTLYEIIEQSFGLPCLHYQELFGAVRADARISKILPVPAGAPLLFIEMLSFTYKDVPYEYRQSHCITDHRRVFTSI